MSDTWRWVLAIWCLGSAVFCLWLQRSARRYYRRAQDAGASALRAIDSFTWPTCARCGPVDPSDWPPGEITPG